VNVASRQKCAVVDATEARGGDVAVDAGAANFRWPRRGAPSALVLTRKHRTWSSRHESGKTVATLEADGDADDLFYDAAQHRLYGCFGAGS